MSCGPGARSAARQWSFDPAWKESFSTCRCAWPRSISARAFGRPSNKLFLARGIRRSLRTWRLCRWVVAAGCSIRGSASVPIITIQTAILHRFRHVLGGDGLGFAQVGDGARQLEDAVVCAGRESHAAHGHFERALAGLVQRAQLADVARGHLGVVETAGPLDGAGAL